jgi:hypothetical protein
MNINLIHLLYQIQYELWFLYTTLVWLGAKAGAETSRNQLQTKKFRLLAAPAPQHCFPQQTWADVYKKLVEIEEGLQIS